MKAGYAFFLDEKFPHRLRHRLSRTFDILILFSLLVCVILYFVGVAYLSRAIGFLFLILAFRIPIFLLESYFRDVFFSLSADEFLYEDVLFGVRRKHYIALAAFLLSEGGSRILLRANISPEEAERLIRDHSHEFRTKMPSRLPGRGFFALSEYLFFEEPVLQDFLFAKELSKEDFLAIALWVVRDFEEERGREWWWEKENLAALGEVGREWAYGETWRLNRYSSELRSDRRAFRKARFFIRAKEVETLVLLLGRSKEANVIITGPPGVGKHELIRVFAAKMYSERAPKHLRGKRIMLFDPLLLISATKTKGAFEEEMLRVISEAIGAGNILLVFNDFPEFIRSAQKLGTDATALLENAFSSSALQVVALADTEGYEELIFPDTRLMSFFESMTLAEPEGNDLLAILEDEAEEFESRGSPRFSFQAIREIREAAVRYLPYGSLPDKALDFMGEVVSFARRGNTEVIMPSLVLALVREKTSIPVGAVTKEEGEKLLNLETLLHKRIIGQDEAIVKISDALRRARADIQNKKRPIGTFLFLGPTGVGKTETAKALAEVIFGGEEHMLRLDMSEFQDASSSERLLGSFRAGKQGILSLLLREHPYGILLLDEFEKASTEVHDLFLQIFDEGFFSDADGKRVNVRNILFIATSNAGSDIIFSEIEKGTPIVSLREPMISYLIREKLFKPELVNRFDGVILFHPLGSEHVREVTELLLGRLAKRLFEQHIALRVTPDLVDAAILFGYDPRFGARNVERAIQDKIEKVISEKILRKEVHKGEEIVLTKEELMGGKSGKNAAAVV